MAKSNQETLGERLIELAEIRAGIDSIFISMHKQEVNGSHLTATQSKRIVGNLKAVLDYINAEEEKTTAMLSKKKSPSKTSMLKTLMKEMSEEEIRELIEEKGITL